MTKACVSRRHQEAEDFALFRDPLRAKLYSPDACRNGHCAEPDEGEQTVYGELAPILVIALAVVRLTQSLRAVVLRGQR